MRRSLMAAVLAASLAGSPVSAQSTIYSTFGPGNSFNNSIGWTVGSAFEQLSGAGFTYGGPSGATLFDLSFAAFVLQSDPILVEFLSGSVTGTVLESWNVPAAGDGVYTLASALNPSLTNGMDYFVRLSWTGGAWWAWNFNNQGYLGVYYSQNGDPFQYSGGEPAPAFAVRAMEGPDATVPEPATMSLLATGLAGLGAARRRRRTA